MIFYEIFIKNNHNFICDYFIIMTIVVNSFFIILKFENMFIWIFLEALTK